MRSPRYTPYDTGQHTLQIGLKPLDLAQWIEADEGFAVQMANKRALLSARYGDVVQMLPESEGGQREVLSLLANHLCAHDPSGYARDGDVMHLARDGSSVDLGDERLPALVRAALLVQEDLCLMQEGREGYRLTAGVLCAPAVWHLREKIGQSLAGIHAPVPGFETSLRPRVDRIFTNLKPELPVWRFNWSTQACDTFFLPERPFRAISDIAADPAGTLWLRVERQTLRRLPDSGAILFTIKTYLDPLASVMARPALAEALARAVRAMPEAMLDYKSLLQWREMLLSRLDEAAAQSS